jgi:hypothetical protein
MRVMLYPRGVGEVHLIVSSPTLYIVLGHADVEFIR